MKETQAFIRKLKSENKETAYDLVKSLMKSMTSNETRVAKNYLMIPHNTEFQTQSLKLFRYIQENPDATEHEARKDFNKGNTNVHFEKTVYVLKTRLGWSLVSEYNTQKEDAYSYKWKTTFEVMHNIMLYYVVVTRQVSGYAFDLLNETIEKAKEVEAYHELTTALELKIRHIKARSEKRAMTRIHNELNFYTSCENAVKEANGIYYELSTIKRIQGISKSQMISSYNEELEKLKQLYKQTNSESILEHCLFIEASLLQLKKEYNEAGKVLLQLNDLTLLSPVLNSKPNLGKSAAIIADNHLLQFNFEVSLTFSKKAKSYFDESSFNYFQVELLEYYAYFYINKFSQAEKKVLGILKNPNYRESEYLINTKKYLLSCAIFAQAKYKEALSMLIGLEKIWDDTTGWNVGIRILTMLCYKMLGEEELLVIERNKFRKAFDKYRHQKIIRERDRIILKIIREFLKPNSDFKSVYVRKSDLFSILTTKGYEWEILSHEMINFEQWFKCIMNRLPYVLDTDFVEDKN